MERKLGSRRRLLRHLAAGLTATFGAGAGAIVRAQTRTRRLRIICGAPGGGTPDVIARVYAEALSEHHPGGVIVDNRPGAASQIAIAALRQSAPDGGTMLLTHGAVVTVYPSLYAKLAYDPLLDLAPISLAGSTAFGFAVGPAVPLRSQGLPPFMAWAREHPSACNYGSPGVGTLPHLLAATLFRESGIRAQHVAYSSGPMATGDALAGRLAAVVLPEGLLRPYHEAGRLRIVASSGEARSRFTPDVPTLAEQGHPTLFTHEWFGFFMPGGAPAAVIEQQSQEIMTAADLPRVQRALDDLAIEVIASRPAAMVQRIAAEHHHWRNAITQLGLRLE
jgi:tripartite-type tricarboxylate transporter receptor subunit TctC